MKTRCAWRLSALAALGALAPASLVSAGSPPPSPPEWSSQFAGAGFTYSVFEQGPVSLLSHPTSTGPKLYVGGEFTAIGGVPYRSLAAFDGRAWSGVRGLVSSFNAHRITMMASMPIEGTPSVIVAGFFEAPGTNDGLGYIDDTDTIRSLPAGPVSPNAWFGSVFAWDSPTGPELTLGSGIFPLNSDYIYRYTDAGYGLISPGLISIPLAAAVFDDGSGPALYLGMARVNAMLGQTMAKWDGTTLTPISPGNSWVTAMTVHDDGSGPALYVAGSGIRRYRGGAWEVVAGAPAFGVEAMASFDDGNGPALYAAGQFTTASGTPATNIARWRHGIWEPLGAGLTGGPVADLKVFDDDGAGPRPPALYAVGKFTHAGGVSSPGIARWGVVICPADFNADGVTNSQDFFEFLSAFFAGAADFNHDGAVNSADFFDYLDTFFGAC